MAKDTKNKNIKKEIKVGDRLGKLTVVQLGLHKMVGKQTHTAALCKCDCGNEVLVSLHHLKQGKVKACGCLRVHPIKSGDMFGDLKALRQVEDKVGKTGIHYETWECLCTACGKVVNVTKNRLHTGQKTHCGCKRATRKRKKFYVPVEVGKTYGDWEVIKKEEQGKWLCRCTKCGAERVIYDSALKKAPPKCREHEVDPMIGQVFGRLQVISRAPDRIYKDGQHEIRYLCECLKCGTIKTVRADRLRLGIVRSCGCLKKDKSAHKEIEASLQPLSYAPVALREW